MGEIKKMTCRSCGYICRCNTGAGMNHARLDSVVALFKEETQQSILSQTQGQKFPLFSFGYQPAYCEQCHDIVSVPVLQLMKAQTRYIGECPKCLTSITPEQLKEKLLCPVCRSGEFDVCRDGVWD